VHASASIERLASSDLTHCSSAFPETLIYRAWHIIVSAPDMAFPCEAQYAAPPAELDSSLFKPVAATPAKDHTRFPFTRKDVCDQKGLILKTFADARMKKINHMLEACTVHPGQHHTTHEIAKKPPSTENENTASLEGRPPNRAPAKSWSVLVST
jgi:hypothetical protein